MCPLPAYIYFVYLLINYCENLFKSSQLDSSSLPIVIVSDYSFRGFLSTSKLAKFRYLVGTIGCSTPYFYLNTSRITGSISMKSANWLLAIFIMRGQCFIYICVLFTFSLELGYLIPRFSMIE